MLFLMDNAHCATAGDTEQNGAKHFTVARRAIVTCFARQKSFIVFFCGARSTLRFRVFPCKCQPN